MLQVAAEVVEELAMVGDGCLWQGYRIKYDNIIIIAYLYTECTPHATIIPWHYFNIIESRDEGLYQLGWHNGHTCIFSLLHYLL